MTGKNRDPSDIRAYDPMIGVFGCEAGWCGNHACLDECAALQLYQLQELRAACNFIAEALAQGGVVFVHGCTSTGEDLTDAEFDAAVDSMSTVIEAAEAQRREVPSTFHSMECVATGGADFGSDLLGARERRDMVHTDGPSRVLYEYVANRNQVANTLHLDGVEAMLDSFLLHTEDAGLRRYLFYGGWVESLTSARASVKQTRAVRGNQVQKHDESTATAVVTAYLMHAQRWSPQQAYMHVLSRRTVAGTNLTPLLEDLATVLPPSDDCGATTDLRLMAIATEHSEEQARTRVAMAELVVASEETKLAEEQLKIVRTSSTETLASRGR